MINGIDEFNEMLVDKYGSDLNDQVEDNGLEKIALSNCLTDYYVRNDPGKLRNLESLVAYAMTNGIEELNKKVILKYGEPLNFEKYKQNESGGNHLNNQITAGHAKNQYDHGKNRNPHVIIIGGGYIGIETASAFSGWGFDVTLIIAHKLAMSKLFTVKMASWFERYFEENHSINIIKETRVVEFIGSDTVKEVVLSNGERLQCDVVICGIGGKPNIELFEGQLKLDESELGGILVNPKLQTSDPNVFAMGDVAAFPHGKYLSRLEHVDNCRKSAAIAAYNVTKPKFMRDYIYFPYFYSRMFEYTDTPVMFRFYGERGNDDEVEIVQFGDFNSSRTSMFGAFWVEKNRKAVIGGLLCNANPPEFYDKLHDIVLSGPTLNPFTEERALALFNEEMIVDLI